MSDSATLHQPTGRMSIHRLKSYWFVACLSSELTKKPKSIRLWGTAIVLFRDASGVPKALLDRCAHRNVPLSQGKCVKNNIQCPYHGWQFDGAGECMKIPALEGKATTPTRRVPSFAVRERQGHIWIFGESNAVPNHEPFSFPHFEDSAYSHIPFQSDFDGTLHANLENILDVPHTAFLHKGLFRGVERNLIETEVRRYFDRAECQYFGEPRPEGLLGKILAPDGGEIEHYDRFILPSIAQVEYRLGDRNIVVSNCLTPITDTLVRMHTVVAVKIRIWTWLLKPFVLPFALRVVKQDQVMLKTQLDCIEDFGGEAFNYTEVDVLGTSISRLMKRASKEQIEVSSTPSDSTPTSVVKGKLWA